jgi:predicted transcriptional regulator
MRQVRGRIVDVLRSRPSAGVAQITLATGFSNDRVDAALDGLVRDGVLVRRGHSYRLPA